MRSSLILVALSFFAVSDAARNSPCKVKETVIPPRHWTQHSRPSPDHVISLKIGLPQPNFHILERHLYQVSDPDHERYGDHLSKAQVDALVAPHPDSLDAVDEWLASHGILESVVSRSSAKDWISLKLPVALVEKMLHTTYHVWENTKTGEFIVRTTNYSLPGHLHAHIDVIQPTTMFAQFKTLKSTIHWSDLSAIDSQPVSGAAIVDNVSGAVVDSSCAKNITLACLKDLYLATNYTPSTQVGNSIGITGYLDQFANIADLQQFYSEQLPQAVGTSFKFVSVNNGTNSQNRLDAGVEADLDVQFAFGLSFPINSTFYSTAGSPPFIPDDDQPTNTNEPYLDWLSFILAQENPPYVISTSYGDGEQTVPKDFAVRVCAGFAQLGARGVSLMFSSGDGGVGDGDSDPTTQTCITNDGTNTTKFIPSFPASCPYVTAVGGTVNIPETAVNFSGGGFSNYFIRPSYQDKVVEGFFNILPNGTYAGLYNRSGRGIPDVSAYSNYFRIIYNGEPTLVGGTSASSPTFSGFVALLNDARLRLGMKPLGFLNPLLYSKGVSGLNDITSGNAPGCGTPGFNATRGWDPVTGLGTPNFPKLKAIVTARGV